MRALTYLWDPEETAFSLGSHILSLTIEEYSRLLMAPPTLEGIYAPNLTKGAANIISKFFGIKHKEVDIALEDCNDWCIKFLTLKQWFATPQTYKQN